MTGWQKAEVNRKRTRNLVADLIGNTDAHVGWERRFCSDSRHLAPAAVFTLLATYRSPASIEEFRELANQSNTRLEG